MPKRRTPYRVIQEHHLSYEPVKTRLVFRIEHRILTWLKRIEKSRCSDTFIIELQDVIMSKSGSTYSEAEMKKLLEANMKKKLARSKRKKRFKKKC